ncbi:SOS response-associated peptidase [Actibacterium sp.]|uniref:SOS response-associated peptidase n=1 Tax=Actibacterium sp. TaxID=1872125 RepID=UPI0035699EDC
MCGRLAVTLPHDAMARLFAATPANDLPPVPDFNLCPGQQIAIVASTEGQRRLRPMRWGFVPQWYKTPTDGPLLINARAETIAEKPAFRAACRQRRGLIPATGYYEWSAGPGGARLPWYIHRSDGAPIAFAAIWQDWEQDGQGISTCAIVTTRANDSLSAVHDRMPLSIEPRDWPLWLGEAGTGAAKLMLPAPEGRFAFHRVSPEVNSNRADGPQLIEPFTDADRV